MKNLFKPGQSVFIKTNWDVGQVGSDYNLHFTEEMLKFKNQELIVSRVIPDLYSRTGKIKDDGYTYKLRTLGIKGELSYCWRSSMFNIRRSLSFHPDHLIPGTKVIVKKTCNSELLRDSFLKYNFERVKGESLIIDSLYKLSLISGDKYVYNLKHPNHNITIATLPSSLFESNLNYPNLF